MLHICTPASDELGGITLLGTPCRHAAAGSPLNLQEEFLELFKPFAARDRLMKAVDGFVDKLTSHLEETAAAKNGRISFDDFMAAPVLSELGK